MNMVLEPSDERLYPIARKSFEAVFVKTASYVVRVVPSVSWGVKRR